MPKQGSTYVSVRNGEKGFLFPPTYINITYQTFQSAFTLPYIILQTTLIGRYMTATMTVTELRASHVPDTSKLCVLFQWLSYF